jgi:hypothetical protein
MQRCLEAGITPGEFWELTLEESFLIIRAYHDRVNVQWQQTRLLIYTIAATVTNAEDRGEIFDLFYIPGDPTPAERIADAKAAYENMMEEQKKFVEDLRLENMKA